MAGTIGGDRWQDMSMPVAVIESQSLLSQLLPLAHSAALANSLEDGIPAKLAELAG